LHRVHAAADCCCSQLADAQRQEHDKAAGVTRRLGALQHQQAKVLLAYTADDNGWRLAVVIMKSFLTGRLQVAASSLPDLVIVLVKNDGWAPRPSNSGNTW
jgi:hypothetical protein